MVTIQKSKFITTLLVVMLVVSALLAGCGGTGPGEAPKQAEGTKETQKPAAENKPAGENKTPAAQKVVVDFWTLQWDDQSKAWWEKWIKEFNSINNNIEVKLSIVPGDAWDQKIKAAQAAGTTPDITVVNYNKIAFSAKQGKLKALDEYVDSKVWSDLHANVEDFVSVGGKHYAFPILVEPSSVLYYRKDMFKEAGLDPEKPPVTWDELIDYGKKLAKNGRYGLLAAGNAVELGWTHWGLQGMIGQRPISDDWSKATINNEAYKQLVAFWKRLHAEGVLPKQSPGGYPDIKSFAEGRSAMAFNGSWAIGALRNTYPELLDKVGVAVLPTPDGKQNKPTASLGGWTLAIDGNAKHPKEAGQFISWMLGGDPKIMVDFFKGQKYSKFAARRSVDDVLNQDPEAKNDPWRNMIAKDIIPYAVAEPIYAWEVSIAYADAVERVVLKNESVEASLAQAEKEINDYIAKNNYAGTNPKLQK